MTAMISKKLEWNRVKNHETLNKNSRHLWRTLKPSFFDGFPLYRAVKALHLQAIMTSRDKVVWFGVTVRLLLAQWCSIRKSSVFLLLNMHIIISSWQMLYFQSLIIRFYRISLILPKRKKITWAHTSCLCLSEISGHAKACWTWKKKYLVWMNYKYIHFILILCKINVCRLCVDIAFLLIYLFFLQWYLEKKQNKTKTKTKKKYIYIYIYWKEFGTAPPFKSVQTSDRYQYCCFFARDVMAALLVVRPSQFKRLSQ